MENLKQFVKIKENKGKTVEIFWKNIEKFQENYWKTLEKSKKSFWGKLGKIKKNTENFPINLFKKQY